VKQKTLFIGAAVSLILVFAVAAVWYRGTQDGGSAALGEAALAALDRDHAPSMGPADAPVTIVEFLDPACETCAQFYPLVKDILAANPGRIRLVLRWAPFHAGSPNVVAVLEAAREQGKFGPALERLLATQSAWAINHTADFTLALMQLQDLGLDSEKLLADMSSPEVAGRIRQDVADASTLNVQATPEYFVNGKPMPSFGYEQLLQLVTEALQETGG
jgi:protein-disulfide isomerase